MTVQTLAAYFLAAMLSWYPLKTHNFVKPHQPAALTEAQTLERYKSIATDLATVVMYDAPLPLDTQNKHPEFGSRPQTGIVMLSFAGFESGGFVEDVDNMTKLGDGGHAVCLMQVHSPFKEHVKDRVSCFREGLSVMRSSWNMCERAASIADHLTGYTVGHCAHNEHGSELRVGRGVKYWNTTPLIAIPDGVATVD
jgi:hypothetical protein